MGDVINLRDAFTESERVTHTLPINKDWEAFIPKTKLLQISAELILGVKEVRNRCEEDLHEHMGLYYLGRMTGRRVPRLVYWLLRILLGCMF